MSEFSESYHIRTDEPEATVQRLVDAGISGFVFTPKNGWLTYVDREVDGETSGGDMSDELVAASGKPVLFYFFQEDYGWGFDYKLPESLIHRGENYAPGYWTQFMCWWNPEDNLVDEPFDVPDFCRMLGRPDLEEKLTEIIQIVDPSEMEPSDDEGEGFAPGWDFAKALGLPAYEYVSGGTLEKNPEAFADLGLRTIGK